MTDSDDVVEARDVLESILAVDRADIPATIQRRTLSRSAPRPETPTPPTPQPRCEIPDWFRTALADAQRALRAAEAREAERSARRERATVAAAAANSVLADVTAETRLDRAALHHAEKRAADARRRHAVAQQRLDAAPRRHRRSLRAELHMAERQLERAEDYLARTRKRTAPAVARHTQAAVDQREAHEKLRDCEVVERLDAMLPSVGEQRLHVRALETWQHWAQGHGAPNRTLHGALAVLAHQPGVERQLAAALRDGLRGTPIDRKPLTAGDIDLARVHLTQPDFGIEL